jgi:hypothetical protein
MFGLSVKKRVNSRRNIMSIEAREYGVDFGRRYGILSGRENFRMNNRR